MSNLNRRMDVLCYVFNMTCCWCRRPVIRVNVHMDDYGAQNLPFRATRDHWVTSVDGGGNGLKNLVLSCAECNNERGRLSVDRWYEKLQARGIQPKGQNYLRQRMSYASRLYELMVSRRLDDPVEVDNLLDQIYDKRRENAHA